MDKYDKVTVTVRTQSGRCFPNHNREIIVIFFAVSDRSTEKKWEEQRMRNLKKALCGIMTGDSGIIGTTKKNLDFTGVSLA